MEFPVPQFIEVETKIVGPFTWRQFVFIGGAGVAIFFLYFIIKHFFLFILISIFLALFAFSFALIRVGGRPLPNVLLNFFGYTVSSKIFIWKKKPIVAALIYKKEKIKPRKEEKKEEGPPLKIAEKSRLQNLSTQVELRTK